MGPTHAVRTLNGYLRDDVTLDELIEWAEQLNSSSSTDPWLARVAAELSNPLLCREQATALVYEFLRSHRR